MSPWDWTYCCSHNQSVIYLVPIWHSPTVVVVNLFSQTDLSNGEIQKTEEIAFKSWCHPHQN